MQRKIFIIQISFLFLYILFKALDWPGNATLTIFSWTFSYLYYFGLSVFKLIKKEFRTSLLYFLFSLLILFIPIKILFTYYNLILHFTVIVLFSILFYKQYNLELKEHFRYLAYFVLAINTLLLFTNSTIVNQNVFSNYTTLPYSSIPLDWSHFNKTDTLIGQHAATIDTYILFKSNKMFNYRSAIAIAVMNRDGSYYKFEHKDVLKHENYHFNITELICRKLNIALNNNHFASYDMTKVIIQNYLDSLGIMQKNYDTESIHGTEQNAQLYWEKYIDAELLKQ